MYETVDHTADLALRIRAPTFTDLVAEGIRGIASVLFEGEPDPSARREFGRARVVGVDPEDALVQALSEALHWMQDEDRVPTELRVRRLGDAELEIELWGVRAEGPACRRCQEIKAVTYHCLEVRETPEGLETVVVLDV